jgi:hypothetical protein
MGTLHEATASLLNMTDKAITSPLPSTIHNACQQGGVKSNGQ